MAFDPKKYASGGGGFNPKAYAAGGAAPVEETDYAGATAAGLQGLLRGLSMGKTDEDQALAEASAMTGAEDAFLESVNPLVAVPSIAQAERADPKFQQIYQERKAELEKLQSEFPKASLAGEFAGGVVSPVGELVGGAVTGVAGRGLKAAGNTAVGQSVKAGASKVANRIAALGDDLGTLAEKNALRSAGAQKSQMKSLVNRGRVKDVGRYIIDEDIVPPGASAEDVFETASKLKKGAGEEISSVFDDIEKAGSGGTFNRKELADGLRNSIYGDDAVAGSLDADKIVPQLEKYIADFEAKNGSASARELLELKGKFDARINYAKKSMDLPELQQGYKNLRGAINDAINSRAENLSNKVRGNLGERLKNANRKYGLASEVESIAENRLAQEGNRFFSLTDSIAGAAGAGAGLVTGGLSSIPMAAAGALGNKALRTYGPAIGTKGIDKVSRALKALGPKATEKTAESGSKLAARIAALESNPGVGERPKFVRKARKKASGE